MIFFVNSNLLSDATAMATDTDHSKNAWGNVLDTNRNLRELIFSNRWHFEIHRNLNNQKWYFFEFLEKLKIKNFYKIKWIFR